MGEGEGKEREGSCSLGKLLPHRKLECFLMGVLSFWGVGGDGGASIKF